MRIVYSVAKCLAVLKNDMEEEEAIEYFEYLFGVRTYFKCEK
jgi:hypothetical protein